MDILIKNSKIPFKTGTWDIGVENGRIAKIEREITGKGKIMIDADGRLVTPTFIDPHIHLDKVLISEVVRNNVSGTLKEAIEIIWDKKQNYTLDDIRTRASRVIELAAKHGTTKMRTHVDVDNIGGLRPLKGVLSTVSDCKDLVDVQIVAFPQEGIVQNEGCEELMRQAMEQGAGIVGGMPANETTDKNSRKHIDICFEIAKDFNAAIDMHVDETDDPNSRTLEYLAAKTIKEKYFGRVTAGHTCALSAYDHRYAAKVISLVKRANINMITNPATNLMLQGRMDRGNIRRGLTRVKELMSSGVNVSFGQDCIKDTFYPTFGKADMLEVGMILAHAVQFSMPKEIDTIFRMLTRNAAVVLGIEKNYGLEVGKPADMNVIDATTVQEAFRLQPSRLYVIKSGRIISKTDTAHKLFRQKF